MSWRPTAMSATSCRKKAPSIPEQGFSMKYQIIERNEKHVNAIVRALKKSDALYLATDPDREGEAISWHLIELLKEKKALSNDKAGAPRGVLRDHQRCGPRSDRAIRVASLRRARNGAASAPRA